MGAASSILNEEAKKPEVIPFVISFTNVLSEYSYNIHIYYFRMFQMSHHLKKPSMKLHAYVESSRKSQNF